MARRKLAYLLLLSALILTAHPAAARGPLTTIEYDASKLLTHRSADFVSLEMEGLRPLADVGEPALPADVLQFVIPADARVEDVVLSFLEERELPGSYRVKPVQPEAPTGEVPEWADPDPAVYDGDALFPPSRVEYLGDGYLGGYRIASVAIYPLQYAPATGRLILATDISVELELEAGADRSRPRHRLTASSDEVYRTLVESMVENPGDVAGSRATVVDVVEEVGPQGFDPRYTPSLDGSPVEYVIITSEELEPYFDDLVEWKTKKGVPTVVRTLTWIEENYPGGSDTPERIRMFIEDAYASWGTTYVLLGGDTSIVPPRYIWSDYYGGWFITCDAYFGDLEGDWNDDGDHIFGEGYGGATEPGDSVDLYVDVFVGRAPAGSPQEVETFVDKVLTYEQSPSALFAERNLFLAEVLFPYDWEPGDLISTDGAEHVVEPVLAWIPSHIRNVRLYQNYDPYPDAYPLTRQSALDSLNVGYNITSHVGHGNKDIMRTSKNEYVVITDVNALTNGVDKSGYLWMLNCTSTAIEFDCIAEHFMNNPNGGCSMLFGPSRFCFPTTAKDYYHSWFEIFYTLDVTRAGAINAACKTPYVAESNYDNTDRWTQMSYLYLGDPETRILTDRPKNLIAVHDASVPLGPASLLVTATDPAAIDSAYVCLVKDGEVYATGYTDASGQVTLNFTPQTTGQMTLTVTAQNHYPYEDTVGVVTSPTPHLTLRDVGIDDDATDLSDGNANGQPEAGETVELNITVGNGGVAAATAVTATLTTTDAYVTIVDTTEYLGDLAAGQHLFNGAFVIAIAESCPNEHYATIEVAFDEAARDSWTDDYTFRIYRPIFVQNLNDVSGAGGDGEPDPGETVTLTIDVLNEGNGDADLVTGILRHTSGEVTVSDSTDSWGNITAGSTVTGQTGFEFTVNSAITTPFELELTDEDGKIWPLSFEMARPGIPDTLAGIVRGTSIELSWYPVADADLWGYNIYRTDHPAGSYDFANDAVIESGARFEDSGLAEEQKYYYKVAAVDVSGNESEWSEVLELSTNPPSMPGWPQELTHGSAEPMYGTPGVCDIDLDGDMEVFVGSGAICCWHHTGVEYIDGDGDPRTNGPFESGLIAGTRTSIAFGELDGDIYPELVAADWGNAGTEEDPLYNVWAWNADDATVVPGWPVTTSKRCWASANLADLDGDGLDEIVIPCSDQKIYCWNGDGSELIDGDNDPATTGVFAKLHYSAAYASAAIADIDNDHELEVICGSRSDSVYCWNPDGSAAEGWPVNLGADVRTTIAVGDVNNDGSLDVVAGTSGNELYLLTATGDVFPNWPIPVLIDPGGNAGDYPASPIIANIDGGDDLEIVAPGTNGTLTVFTWEGDELPGWPQVIDSRNNSSPSVGDVDGDPGVEILIGSYGEKKVWAFDADGDLVDGWPILTGADVWSTPTFADLDDDGDVEIVLSGMDVSVYVWDCQGDYTDGAEVEWGTFMHDFRRWSHYDYEEPVGVPEDDVAVAGRLTLEQNTPNPFNPVTTIAFTIPTDATEIDLSIYNVAGERVATLVSGDATPGRQSVTWNGHDDAGERVASGIYFMRLTSDADTKTRKVVLLK